VIAAIAGVGVAQAQTVPSLNSVGSPNDRVLLISTRLTDAADQYVSQLDARVYEIPLISAVTIDPDHDLIPNWEKIATNLDNECTPGYNGVICLDWEGNFFEALKEGPSGALFQSAMNQGVALLNFVRSKRPNAKVGFYGIPSIRWDVEPSALQPLFNASDVFLPSGYLSSRYSYAQNKERVVTNMQLALELANGKPVLMYHWPRVAPKGGPGLEMAIIEREQLIDYIATTFSVEVNGRRAAGVCIWDNTVRLMNQGHLETIDIEYIAPGMDLETYVTNLQRYYICAAMQAVIPGTNCSQPMPTNTSGNVAGAPSPQSGGAPGANGSLPGANENAAGSHYANSSGGVQGRRHIIDVEAYSTSSSEPQGAMASASSGGVASGINLAPLNPEISGWSFTNFVWLSSPWDLLGSNNQVVEPDAERFGYPVSANDESVQTIIGAGMQSILPPGRWLCQFEGQGDITFAGDAVFLRESQGRILFRVTPSDDGVVMKMSHVSSGDPVRNARVVPFSLRMEAELTSLHPQLINRLTPAHPQVLRFAAWQKVSGSPLQHWNERPTLKDLSQVSDRGAAFELMFELCSRMSSDAWISMPHQATDEFVRECAMLAKSKLDARQRVYVEYSSNMFETASAQYAYAVAQGAAANLGSTPDESAAMFYARRAQEMMTIWREVFAEEPGRVVGVLSVPNEMEAAGHVLNQQDAVAAADMISIAGGFGGAALMNDLQLLASGLTIDQTVGMLTERRDSRLQGFETIAAMIRATGKPMAVSRCGAGLLVASDGLDSQLIRQLRQVENDPRTIALIESERSFWVDEGAVLILTDDQPAGAP